MRYGYSVEWRESPGVASRVEVSDFGSSEEARAEAILFAIRGGWKPPRWYEWWRWGEVRQPLVDVLRWIANEKGPHEDPRP